MPKSEPLIPQTNIGLVKPRNIQTEMQESYLDYAMSVIVSRALPDVRDGLKPVHRRILYVMHEMGLRHAAKFRKSAAVVGDVLGKYHPHGDVAVYDSMVHMAQDFAMRYPLIDGQGNFGCFTGDTKIALADGRELSFKDLIKEYKAGKTNFTYTFNPKTEAIEIAEIKHPRLTTKKASLIEVKLDNGETIRCTPNHKFMLRDGNYKEAQNLQPSDSLMPLYFRLSTKADDPLAVGYRMVKQPLKNIWGWARRMADAWNLQRSIYKTSAGKVRHHLDFNKLNNNPTNIQRMQWADHFRLHAKLAGQRHQDPNYVAKIKQGRDAYWLRPENRKKNSQLLSLRNKQWWNDPKYRAERILKIQELWKDPGYKKRMKAEASKNIKTLWQTPGFRQILSQTKSEELKKRWQNPEYRKEMAEIIRATSLELWQNPAHRAHMTQLLKERWNDPVYRARQSQRSKTLWRNAVYRNRFAKDHFSKMAKGLWADPKIQKLHSEKAKKQWLNPDFRTNIIAKIKQSNKNRRANNPNLMKELATKAADSLRLKWQNPEYKARVIKSKILGFVNKLINLGIRQITSGVYNQNITNNGIPKFNKALGYFANVEEMIEEAKAYNHKIISIKRLQEQEDVFDLTIDATHNFALACGIFVHNSMDGDGAAAYRYTETRMTQLAEELLTDIEKETVGWRDNFDATRKEPVVLPGKLPNLLLNGTLGIAVGMATDIPPHNLTELCDAIVKLIDEPDATTEDLLEFVKGPDFPTGGIIYDVAAIKNAYATGKGSIVMRAKTEITETKTGAFQIQVHEIPYRVNKATLLQKIADLVRDKKLEGIKDIRDESDKDGVRIVVDLKKDALANKILNQLFSYTQLQETFHLNMLSLVDGIEPHVLNLKTILEKYLEHRQIVIKRRTEFELKKAKEREHILEGLKKALDHIDQIISTIKKSATREEAHANLVKKFKLTDIQAQAILEMRLQTLAGLERKKIEDELKEKKTLIAQLEDVLKSTKKILGIIKKEVLDLKQKFGDERKTQVVKNAVGTFSAEDLIPEENVIITVTKSGYVKRLAPDTYRQQARGGKGVIGQTLKEEDVVEKLITSNTHDEILFFTNKGRVFQTKVYELPEGSRTSKGQALVNFLQLGAGETAQAVLTLTKKDQTKFLVMATKNGLIKKTGREEFTKVRRSGMIAIGLKGNDELKWVEGTSGEDQIMLSTPNGQAIRFSEKDVRPMGRNASGVAGMRIKKGDELISMDIIRKAADIKNLEVLVVTENGLGKKSKIADYKVQRRAGGGVKTLKVTPKTGKIVAMYILDASEEHDLVVISKMGQTIRTPLNSVSTLGRATQGVRVMKLDEGDKVASATII